MCLHHKQALRQEGLVAIFDDMQQSEAELLDGCNSSMVTVLTTVAVCGLSLALPHGSLQMQ